MNKAEAIKSINTPLSDEVVIRLSGISKKYNLYNKKQDRLKEALHPRRKKYHRNFYALKDINLEVKRGEVLGIVGKNGSGKSTLLTIISGILTPTDGTVETKGSIVPLLELGAGFNPEFTGLENIYFYCSLLGFDRQQTDDIVDEIIDFAELGEFIHQPIKTYSSGMKARLAFAVSVNVDPDILILDEILAVGDELFKRKCYARMEQFFKGGKTILFVSHSVQSVNQLCTRAILLDRGECILDGPAKIVTMYYQKMLHAIKGKGDHIRKEIIELNKKRKFELYNYSNQEDLGEVDQPYSNKLYIYENFSISVPNETTFKDVSTYRAYYLPNFKPKSTVEHKNYDLDVYNFEVSTLNGNKVNHLITGERYIYSYRVRFNISAENVAFGASIKNDKGLHISGANLKKINHYISHIFSGDEYIIEYGFSCYLLEGIYYFQAGIVKDDNTILYRVADSLVFKVLPNDSMNSGIISLYQQINYKKV